MQTKALNTAVTFMLHMEQKSYKIEIINDLLRGNNHIRGIAKNLHINHMTIARKMKLAPLQNRVWATSLYVFVS